MQSVNIRVVEDTTDRKCSSQKVTLGEVRAYTDGASHGRRGAGGWGVVLMIGAEVRELSGSEPDTTNQRMEITAACEALESLPQPFEVTVYSDSSYLVNCMRRRWYEAWRSANWLNSRRKPVANRDLWERLLVAAKPHRVAWRKVRGHRKSEGEHKPGNDRADALAVAAKLCAFREEGVDDDGERQTHVSAGR